VIFRIFVSIIGVQMIAIGSSHSWLQQGVLLLAKGWDCDDYWAFMPQAYIAILLSDQSAPFGRRTGAGMSLALLRQTIWKCQTDAMFDFQKEL
jgi:hypothetical protein